MPAILTYFGVTYWAEHSVEEKTLRLLFNQQIAPFDLKLLFSSANHSVQFSLFLQPSHYFASSETESFPTNIE